MALGDMVVKRQHDGVYVAVELEGHFEYFRHPDRDIPAIVAVIKGSLIVPTVAEKIFPELKER